MNLIAGAFPIRQLVLSRYREPMGIGFKFADRGTRVWAW